MSFRPNSRAVQRVPIDSLRLAQLAVQRNPKKQVEKAAKFVAEFDQVPLIYAGPDGEILFGEEFWLALKQAGASEVDAIFINNKSPAELATIRLALHRIPEDARWDDHNVRVVLGEIENCGIDLDLSGFDPPEIDGLLNLDLPRANTTETGFEVPEVESTPVSELGMIWQLGEHRLGCGSATDLELVRQVCGGNVVKMSFIDPPYNEPTQRFKSGGGRGRRREQVQGGKRSDEEYFARLRNVFAVLQSLSNPLIFACVDWSHITEMLVAGRACGLSLSQIVCWIKSNGRTGGLYKNQHELICVFRSGHDQSQNNVELGKRGRVRTNVWQHYEVPSFGKIRGKRRGLRPTGKPVAMIADAVRDCTKRGDLIADTFAGCGGTLMAAEETGRCFRGVERDPLYVDVAVRRWQILTGRDAVSVGTGEPFNAARRRLLTAPMEPNHGS